MAMRPFPGARGAVQANEAHGAPRWSAGAAMAGPARQGWGRAWLWAGWLLLALAGCDDGLETQNTPGLQISPETGFLFPRLAAGTMAEREVELRSTGPGRLTLTDFRLADDSTDGEFALFLEQGGERSGVPRALTLDPDQAVTLVVIYAVTDDSAFPDRGQVVFGSNDPDHRDVALPIVTGEIGAEIDIAPRTIDFGPVEAGGMSTQGLVVRNLGLVDLVISRVSVNGPADFTARLGDRQLTGDGAFEPIVVPASGRIDLDVTYAPPSAGPDRGELLIESNDAVRPISVVGLVANGAAACLRVVPDSVEFGAALQVDGRDGPTPNVRLLSIESCGSSPLRVDRLEFMGAEAFGLAEPLDPIDPNVPDSPLIELPEATPGQPFPSRSVSVGFWPLALQAYGGTLLVHSNAEDSPTQVQLFGRGVDNSCPIPRADPDVYNVQPLDILTLDGSLSEDPGGRVVEWEWTVVERPEGSVSVPLEGFGDPRRPADGGEADRTDTATTQFFVDLAGRYVVHLRVKDNLGQWSCDPTPFKEVVINAVPEKDIHIQLVWSTPDDPDQADRVGTDVDLHFKHQLAGDGWSTDADGFDCYFANTNPDWGLAGEVSDNPSLDIDDTNGAGPENVNLARPEVGVTYEVGAIYFRAESTFGVQGADPRTEHASYITLRVFARGELLAEVGPREVTTLRQLWRAATVEWCEDLNQCPRIGILDEVLSEAEYDLP